MDLPPVSETFNISGPSNQTTRMLGVLNDTRKVS